MSIRGREAPNPGGQGNSAAPSYVCDICGKTFASERSLKFHKLRAHRIPVQQAAGRGPSPPAARGGGRKGAVTVPDALERLKNALLTFGLSARDAEAAVKAVEPFGPDDLERLEGVLADLNMPLNKRRLFIEYWATDRHLVIPPSLRAKLKIRDYPPPAPDYYGPAYPSPYYPRPAPQTSEHAALIQALAQFLQAAREQDTGGSHGGDNSALLGALEALRAENAELRQKLESLEARLAEERQKALEERLKRIEERLTGLQKTSDATVAFIQEAASVLREGLSIYKLAVERTLGRVRPLSELPKGEAMADVLTYLPPELVEGKEGGEE